jgi:DNA-binding MarR family transcriptional regulator
MQAGPHRELIRMFLERIIKEAFPEETPAARLQQVGLFTLIYMMEYDEEPLTAARLARFTGLAEAQVHTHLKKLIRRELIERTEIKSKHGKGRSYQLSVKHTAKTKRLINALEKSSGAKGKSDRKKP